MSAVSETMSTPAEAIVHDAVILDSDPATYSTDFADTWLAVAGGTVLARGRGAHWQSLAGPDTEVVDAAGAHLAPAFVDMHVHGAGDTTSRTGRTTSARSSPSTAPTAPGRSPSPSSPTGSTRWSRRSRPVPGPHAAGPTSSASTRRVRSSPRISRAPTHPRCSPLPPPRRSTGSSRPPTVNSSRSPSPPNCPARSTRSVGSPRRGEGRRRTHGRRIRRDGTRLRRRGEHPHARLQRDARHPPPGAGSDPRRPRRPARHARTHQRRHPCPGTGGADDHRARPPAGSRSSPMRWRRPAWATATTSSGRRCG